jgi:Tol biopolymer transport system component
MRAKISVPTLMTAVGAAGLVGSALWMTTPPAAAAFPGNNGDIAFVSTRNNNVAIYQVNPQGSGLGTTTGDEANTTPLTGGAVDAEPFYSPDGATVYFSSNRSGFWTIYSIAQSAEEPPTTPTELSQVSGSESHDDYSPSVAPNGETVVFNRDNAALYTLYASAGASSVCLLYTPPEGLAPASSDNGSGSRAVFDPDDPTKLIYVGGDNHLHLLSGIPNPTGTNPCSVSPSSLTDTDLSAEATAPAGESITGAADANPDWNPAGLGATSVKIGGHSTNVIFDSTRGGGHTLWTMDLTTATPTVTPIWSGLVGAGNKSDTQPVFSPDGNYITYTEPVVQDGTQVMDYELDKLGQMNNLETDLTQATGTPANSQPDWQPTTVAAETPEAPMAVLLPASGLVILGGALGFRRRRGRRLTSA